jgi:hypothetical protein
MIEQMIDGLLPLQPSFFFLAPEPRHMLALVMPAKQPEPVAVRPLVIFPLAPQL